MISDQGLRVPVTLPPESLVSKAVLAVYLGLSRLFSLYTVGCAKPGISHLSKYFSTAVF